MVRHYRRTEATGGGGFDGPATDVSVSGYSGRKMEPLKKPQRVSAPKKMEYLVKSGDCLSKIAQSELGSVKHLKRLLEVNGLSSSSTLRVGQRLILPFIGESAPVRVADLKRALAPAPALDNMDWAMVTVLEGDSLWKIAARVFDDGNRYREIMDWNDLNSETLQPGTKLRVQVRAGAALAMGGATR